MITNRMFTDFYIPEGEIMSGGGSGRLSAPTEPVFIPGSPITRIPQGVDALGNMVRKGVGLPVDLTIQLLRGVGINAPEDAIGSSRYFDELVNSTAKGGSSRLGGAEANASESSDKGDHPVSDSYEGGRLSGGTSDPFEKLVREETARADKEGRNPSFHIAGSGASRQMGAGPMSEDVRTAQRDSQAFGPKEEGTSAIAAIDNYLMMHEKFSPDNILKAVKKAGLPPSALPQMLKMAEMERSQLPDIHTLQKMKMGMESPELAKMLGMEPKGEEQKKKAAFDRFKTMYSQLTSLQKSLTNVKSFGRSKEEDTTRIQQQINTLSSAMKNDPEIASIAQMYLAEMPGAGGGGGGQVTRTGIDRATGKKIVQYSDGSVAYAD